MKDEPDASHADKRAWRGGVLALGAALLFGASTPLIQHFSSASGAFWTAALLYVGAAVAGWAMRGKRTPSMTLQRKHLPRLLAVAFFGAALGPTLLAWGLQHTSAASASLVLVLEAVFTALLARLFYRERIGRRVIFALLLMTVGGAALTLENPASGTSRLMGLLAVALATLAWALDNALSRPLSDLDPGRVVLGKAALGATATIILALSFGQSLPPVGSAAALLVVGATGYGLSLRLYLLAQREFGAARTGSVFAFAPFLGAALSLALVGQFPGWGLMAGGLLMLIGLVLHLTETNTQDPGRGVRIADRQQRKTSQGTSQLER